MKRGLAILSLATLLCGSGAFAQVDPDMDGVGIYFDPCACNHCVTLPEGEHFAWLTITHPTAPMGVHGWECRIDVQGPAVVLNWDIQGLWINADTPPSFAVGLAEPISNDLTYPAVVVMEIRFLLMSIMSPVEFYLLPTFTPSLPDKLVYVDGGDVSNLIEMMQSTGGPGEPVAVVNGDCPIAVEAFTWGQVKSLYKP